MQLPLQHSDQLSQIVGICRDDRRCLSIRRVLRFGLGGGFGLGGDLLRRRFTGGMVEADAQAAGEADQEYDNQAGLDKMRAARIAPSQTRDSIALPLFPFVNSQSLRHIYSRHPWRLTRNEWIFKDRSDLRCKL